MLVTIEFCAVISSAIYGILLACRKELDVVGVFAIAFTISFGGGTLRDVFLDRHPLFWIANDHYVVIVLVLSISGAILPRLVARLEKFLLVPDALGLALFSITGAGYALEGGTSLLIASMMAVLTGTFGGVIADVIINEIPRLFRSAPLYAICAFTGTWVYLILQQFNLPASIPIISGFAAIFLLRMAAVRWDIRLPNAKLDG
ncbi:MAG: trimeric intracellular cation channel family protein [Deferribacteres bacterium]|nr:trimeric intracellular cation channel family protein [candidate division KSB1 bacterium]MCB9509773.1 trimeric intracellular cation channel family protein [Deferribacteres bacterium]